eukprot:SAG25_NODE_32_length_20323_cov_59.467721_6_plen_62_part_00
MGAETTPEAQDTLCAQQEPLSYSTYFWLVPLRVVLMSAFMLSSCAASQVGKFAEDTCTAAA